MAEAVYFLCGATSILCAFLLFRGYRRSRTSLLLWSSLCFLGLALSNVLVVIDLVAVPNIDLSFARSATALVAMLLLVFGLIWERR